jgi:glycosyltransferase involved in cell wall biosynthesis
MLQVEGPMRVAVVIPCLDEAAAIGRVLDDFRAALPDAELVVVDNGSSDGTGEIAARHGATVLVERRRGKGHAVRRAFRAVDADAYLLVDGDGTYPASAAGRLLEPVLAGSADVAIGGRLDAGSGSNLRALNRLGNRLFLTVVNFVFGAQVTDLLTGYRAMSREFAKHAPVLSTGFELETELTVLALERGFRTVEIPIRLGLRPDGSRSKIRIGGDGLRILNAIFTLLRDYRPLTFFGGLGLLAILAGLAPGLFVTWEFTRTGFVRVPTALLATGLELLGFTSILTGVILTTLARRFRELEHQIRALRDEAPPPVSGAPPPPAAARRASPPR